MLLHFGDKDASIPLTDVAKVQKAHPEVAVHIYEAEHGFNCDHRAAYNTTAAKLARERTMAFLAKNVG